MWAINRGPSERAKKRWGKSTKHPLINLSARYRLLWAEKQTRNRFLLDRVLSTSACMISGSCPCIHLHHNPFLLSTASFAFNKPFHTEHARSSSLHRCLLRQMANARDVLPRMDYTVMSQHVYGHICSELLAT